MKHSKLFLLALTVAIGVFSAAVYTSCTKTAQCSAACLNGGSCNNGTCKCPSGFSGNQCQYTNIVYRNPTYTYLLVTVSIPKKSNKDTSFIIAPSGTAMVQGTPGDTAWATGYTYGPVGPATVVGTGSTPVQFGETIEWNGIYSVFLASGNQFVDFHVDSRYFFLQVNNQNGGNTGSDNIVSFVVNTLYSSQNIVGTNPPVAMTYTGNFTVPNDSAVHPVGYFGAATGSDVTTTDALGNTLNFPLGLVPSLDKAATVIVP